jgi:hypothetical protein
MNQRIKLVLVIVAILAICSVTFFITVTTVHTIQQLQSQNALAARKDTSTLQPWMTLSYISTIYSVPLPTLETGIASHNITASPDIPLYAVATSHNISDITLLHIVQHIINSYRNNTHAGHRYHKPGGSPTPAFTIKAEKRTM